MYDIGLDKIVSDEVDVNEVVWCKQYYFVQTIQLSSQSTPSKLLQTISYRTSMLQRKRGQLEDFGESPLELTSKKSGVCSSFQVFILQKL